MVSVQISRLSNALHSLTRIVLNDALSEREGSVVIALDYTETILPLADARRLHQALGSVLALPHQVESADKSGER